MSDVVLEPILPSPYPFCLFDNDSLTFILVKILIQLLRYMSVYTFPPVVFGCVFFQVQYNPYLSHVTS